MCLYCVWNVNRLLSDDDICCESSEIRNGTIKLVDMSSSNTFVNEVKNLTENKRLANNHVCFSYKPKWYDHGHYARCQVQAKSIYICKKSTEISAGFGPFGIIKE